MHYKVCLKETRQVIYVLENTSGFYLSESALKDLGLIPHSFLSQISKADMLTTDDRKAPCGCPQWMTVPDKPARIPFIPIESNRDHLEQWLQEHFKSSMLNTCPHQPLQVMTGRWLDITFTQEAKISAVHTPVSVSHYWKKRVKENFDQDVALGIIKLVLEGTPTVRCSRILVTPKKDGLLRRTVDRQKLNAATMRETHHTLSPFNQVSIVPTWTKKTILDAWNRYHSLLISSVVLNTTMFMTEWGCYRYLRAPQGFHASGYGYTDRFDDIMVDMPQKTHCIDDILLWDETIESAFWTTSSTVPGMESSSVCKRWSQICRFLDNDQRRKTN